VADPLDAIAAVNNGNHMRCFKIMIHPPQLAGSPLIVLVPCSCTRRVLTAETAFPFREPQEYHLTGPEL